MVSLVVVCLHTCDLFVYADAYWFNWKQNAHFSSVVVETGRLDYSWYGGSWPYIRHTAGLTFVSMETNHNNCIQQT